MNKTTKLSLAGIAGLLILFLALIIRFPKSPELVPLPEIVEASPYRIAAEKFDEFTTNYFVILNRLHNQDYVSDKAIRSNSRQFEDFYSAVKCLTGAEILKSNVEALAKSLNTTVAGPNTEGIGQIYRSIHTSNPLEDAQVRIAELDAKAAIIQKHLDLLKQLDQQTVFIIQQVYTNLQDINNR